MESGSFGILEQLLGIAGRAGLADDSAMQEVIRAASLSGDKNLITDLAAYLEYGAIEETLEDPAGFGKPTAQDVDGPAKFGTEARTGQRCGLDLRQDSPIVIIGITQVGKTTLLKRLILYCITNDTLS